MFNKHNGAQGDYVTRTEAERTLSAYVTREDAQEAMDALAALDRRVTELETLARSLRGNSASVSAPVAQRSMVAGSDALTRRDAEAALNSLRQAGEREFNGLRTAVRELSAKIDTAVSDLVQRSQGTAPAVRQEVGVTHTGAESISRVDYGAVAYGLSSIKRDVAGVIGAEARNSDLAEHYRQTVQYFVDVFAKADPAFDANLFRRQAGV